MRSIAAGRLNPSGTPKRDEACKRVGSEACSEDNADEALLELLAVFFWASILPSPLVMSWIGMADRALISSSESLEASESSRASFEASLFSRRSAKPLAVG